MSKLRSTLKATFRNIIRIRAIRGGTRTFGVLILLCLLLGCLGGPCFTTLVCVCLALSFTMSAHDFATVKRKRC